MSLEVRVEAGDRMLQVALAGHLTLGPSLHGFRRQVADRLVAGQGVVLDLAAVGKIDSAGVGELMSLYTTVLRKQGRLALSRVPDAQREVFRLLRLERILPAFDSAEAAAAWVRQG